MTLYFEYGHRKGESKMDKLKDLIEQRQKLEERIKQLESELKKPLTADSEESAVEEDGREVLYSLYQVEKENLARITADINEGQ
jgi:chaperonin cofactor prefoldin